MLTASAHVARRAFDSIYSRDAGTHHGGPYPRCIQAVPQHSKRRCAAGRASSGPPYSHLPGRALAALRSTCSIFRQLVDSAPAEALTTSLRVLLPPALAAQEDKACLGLQSMLREQVSA